MSGQIKRRVYIATQLNQNELQKQFAGILARYAQADSAQDAEFIIFDLDHPPKPFSPYVQDRRDVTGEPIRPEALVPLLIRSSAAPTAGSEIIRQEMEQAFNSVRLHQTEDELLKDMQWIESMIPYVKVKVTKEQQDLARAFAVRMFTPGGGI